MGKRSNFERVGRDYYPTPLEPVKYLESFLEEEFTYAEPCAGDGRLVKHLSTIFPKSTCLLASDIEPMCDNVEQYDARNLWNHPELNHVDYVITNPPWDRSKKSGYLLHALIREFVEVAPTWLLFDADWVHTKQSGNLVSEFLTDIVPIGRVKWIEDSPYSGKDNVCWYRFSIDGYEPANFHPRL